jgi:hypothetical protein
MVRRSEKGSHGGSVPHEGFALSPEVKQVFTDFRTCEFSTLARDGTPITWPLITLW